jgi:hypothetical protein
MCFSRMVKCLLVLVQDVALCLVYVIKYQYDSLWIISIIITFVHASKSFVEEKGYVQIIFNDNIVQTKRHYYSWSESMSFCSSKNFGHSLLSVLDFFFSLYLFFYFYFHFFFFYYSYVHTRLGSFLPPVAFKVSALVSLC